MGSAFAYDLQLRWANGQTLTNATFTSTAQNIGYKENMCCLLEATSATAGQIFTLNVYDGTSSTTFGANPVAMYRFTGAALTGVTAGAPVTIKIPFVMSEGRPWIRVTVVAPAAGTIVFSGYYGDNSTKVVTNQLNV